MGRRRTILTVGAVTIGLCLVALLVAIRADIAVAYHRHCMMSAWTKVSEHGFRSPKQSDFIEAFEYHRDVLVALGFFERREYPLQHISVPSLESRRLWEELEATFPDHGYAQMHGYEPETQDMLIVWDRPQNLAAWEAIIDAHDQPAAETTEVEDLEAVLRFVGSWAAEDGDVCYIISSEPSRGVKIKMPPDDAWETRIKNVCLHDGCLMFDEYHYTSPRDDFKTIVNRSGEHPFGGVRCQVVLELDPDDPKRMTCTMKTIHTPEPITTTLRRTSASEVGD